ncbi:phytanoyl-CoA dioxygenase family protein [Nostoc sp. LEGE 06077]|uniref:phytanoyl-CoA dioxygenase family protein n=1 Tax=Nostoc sp. LEGE 06077 TaxID=915325 RepID=UPI0018807D19|nr:phytanoyl-CoA dioxygenase family protein [Nostoc sp. LEGE 06077]MBE9208076.1 phytanoyl-CoA dioxygenase family protein [Nostoc sp. LEGE 06077]
MLNTLQGKMATLNSELAYRIKLWQYAPKLPVLEESDRQIVNTLKREGAYVTSLTDLGLTSTPEMLKAAYQQLSRMADVNNTHLSEKLPQIYTVTDLPEFFNWGQDNRLLKIVENYIGLPVTFHGVHLRKDFPNEHQFGTLLWHKDSEDRKIVKVIIYLHDVAEKHGPFEYIPLHLTSFPHLNSYRIDYQLWQSGYLGINDEEVQKIIPKSAWKSCPGAAGTVVIADPRTALHHGTIRTEARLALFFVYTANPPKRPELCTQYWDDTFSKPEMLQEIS